jgi:methanogenic corrinoid protein MtbC1
MLRWCAYCQEFQGEIAPLDKFSTTHGLCSACRAKGTGQLDSELDNSHRLREIQGLLYEAGKKGDMSAAPAIVHDAIAAGLRPVDILVGIITPLLYLIGIEWEISEITIADENRFTRFCEHVFELVKLEVASRGIPGGETRRALVFLMNARGNTHSLGIRILSLWLQSAGIETREFHPPPSPDLLIHFIAEEKPQAVLISLALASQRDYVATVARRIAELPQPQPTLIVGGYGIKHNLIRPISGALFLETINGLTDLIWNLEYATETPQL